MINKQLTPDKSVFQIYRLTDNETNFFVGFLEVRNSAGWDDNRYWRIRLTPINGRMSEWNFDDMTEMLAKFHKLIHGNNWWACRINAGSYNLEDE